MAKHDHSKKPSSPWASGSFYVVTVVVILATLGALSQLLEYWTVAMVAVAGLVFVAVVGALQLRHDDRLGERSFLSLMALSFRQLPLIGRLQDRGRKEGPKKQGP